MKSVEYVPVLESHMENRAVDFSMLTDYIITITSSHIHSPKIETNCLKRPDKISCFQQERL